MEPLDTLTPDPHQPQQPRILEQDYVLGMLTTTYKWTKFLGIMGFIGCAFIVLAAFSMMALGNSFSNMEGMPYAGLMTGSLLGGIYLLMGLLYFFPSLYLYQYAEKLKVAIHTRSEEQLILALDKNKAFFRFIGIMMVVTLIIYFLAFIGAIAFGVAAGGAM